MIIETVRLLAIAFYNKGIELGLIGNKIGQLQCFKSAYMTLSRKIGAKDALALKFKKAYKKLK